MSKIIQWFATFHTVVLLCVFGFVVSAAFYYQFSVQSETEFKNRIGKDAESYFHSLYSNLLSSEETVSFIAGLFSSSKDISRQDFRFYVKEALEKHSALQAVSWNPLIHPHEREYYASIGRQEGFEDFYITELNDQGEKVKAVSNNDHVAVLYIEPYAENTGALGFDIASNKDRLNAINATRDNGEAVATERIRLVQSKSGEYGFLLLKAVYRKGSSLLTIEQRRENFTGVAVGVYKFSAWVEDSLKKFPENQLDLVIYDKSAEKGNQTLYVRTKDQSDNSDALQYRENIWRNKINFGNRQWLFEFTPTSDYISENTHYYHVMILLAGILVTLTGAYYQYRIIIKSRQLSQANASLKKEMLFREKAEKKMIESRMDLLRAQRLAKLGSWQMDLLNNEVSWSEEVYRIFDVDESTFIPSYAGIMDLIHPEDRDAVNEAYLQSIKEKTTFRIEHRLLLKDASIKYVIESGETFFDNEGIGLRSIGTVLDITERKNLELQMEHEKNRALQAEKIKSQFLANMSHEIRTPMNAIIGMTHLVLKTNLDDKQKNFIKKAHLAANRLLGIINDILDYSKIESGMIELESSDFNLNDVIEHMMGLVKFKADENDIKLVVKTGRDVPLSLVGDQLRLGQVLINLVSNAVKFSEPGGTVTFVTSLKSLNDEQVVLHFSVIDTGIGMNDEQQLKLFKSFSQADSSVTRKYGGTGLGLSISKRIAELMNGDIWVASKAGEGSTFHFTATLNKGLEEFTDNIIEDKTKENVSMAIKKLRGLKVLVVDDNDINQELLNELLTLEDIKVESAFNGKEAVDRLDKEHFDCVLMDWMMPVMNGDEAACQIRLKDQHKDLPIIALTASAMVGDREKLLKAGMNDYISKPIDPDIMFLTMEKWISKSR